jgi:hypothetical protein
MALGAARLDGGRWVRGRRPSPAASRSYLVFDATIPSAGAEYTTLIDLAVLRAIPKTVQPIERLAVRKSDAMERCHAEFDGKEVQRSDQGEGVD